jgi:hypothetical protein
MGEGEGTVLERARREFRVVHVFVFFSSPSETMHACEASFAVFVIRVSCKSFMYSVVDESILVDQLLVHAGTATQFCGEMSMGNISKIEDSSMGGPTLVI